jgi:hypothetical protein
MPGANRRTTQGRFQGRNPDLRRQVQMSGPEIEQLEQNLRSLLRPDDFTPMRLRPDNQENPEKLRDRLLTLPVMLAVILGLIYRKVPGLAEASRVLWGEGLLWVGPLKVSRQALSQRLMKLPAQCFASIFEEVLQHFQAKPLPPAKLIGSADLHAKFTVMWIADGSTLEELRKRLKILRTEGTILAGKMMMVVDLFSHRPVASWYTNDAAANDKQWLDELIERLPTGGLLVYDLGFFKFSWFDQFTDSGKYFVTRQREKTKYEVLRVLSSGSHYRDEIIQMGQYRSNPCKHPVRMVSVLWGTTWYRYLTNVLGPKQLSAQQVCDIYRRRWRIEDAFGITKRLLGLAYIWVGHSNGVEIQVYATWIFYALINDLCADVAIAMNQPLDAISLEMVFRGLYHFNSFSKRGEASDVILFLSTNAKRLGLVKAQNRRRDRDKNDLYQAVWGIPEPLS